MHKPNKILKKPYAAYYNAEVPDEDEELTHVGPGTPCGEYLRRFWHPVSRTDALKDLALPIRILGEDLLVEIGEPDRQAADLPLATLLHRVEGGELLRTGRK